jgi:predicted RNase H-like nuclease (RuvC/YqgF family)
LNFDNFSESVKTYQSENDALWRTQLDENSQVQLNLTSLKQQIETRFDDQRKQNNILGEGITNAQNRCKALGKQLEEHHKVQMSLQDKID